MHISEAKMNVLLATQVTLEIFLFAIRTLSLPMLAHQSTVSARLLNDNKFE